jgi:hypothetical protein
MPLKILKRKYKLKTAHIELGPGAAMFSEATLDDPRMKVTVQISNDGKTVELNRMDVALVPDGLEPEDLARATTNENVGGNEPPNRDADEDANLSVQR